MRHCRIQKDGARYHISARINNKEMVLESEQVKHLFEDVLVRAKAKFSFQLENFVIMGNHYHLILKPGKNENLSRIMQWIMSVFAMTYNRLFNHSGHVWERRFFSRILDSLQEYVKVCEYIDCNPVKAGLVGSPQEWNFGGLYHHRMGLKYLVSEIPEFVKTLIYAHTQHCIS